MESLRKTRETLRAVAAVAFWTHRTFEGITLLVGFTVGILFMLKAHMFLPACVILFIAGVALILYANNVFSSLMYESSSHPDYPMWCTNPRQNVRSILEAHRISFPTSYRRTRFYCLTASGFACLLSSLLVGLWH
jgi:hypothetical protein